MKNNLLKTGTILCALIGGMAINSGVCAAVYDANDWYGFTTNPGSISNGSTTSPTMNYSTSQTGIGAVWSYFTPNASPISLEHGMTMTLDTTITTVYRSGANPTAVEFRFGLFDSGASRPASAGGRTVVSSSYATGWTGFLTTTAQSGTESNKIWRRNTGGTTNYSSSSQTAMVALSDGFSSLTLFPDNTGVSLTLSLTRSGNDLLFSGILGADSFSGTYTNAFASGYPATFDAVGFYGLDGMTGGTSSVQSVTFANTTVTVVPEPASLALLVVAGAVLLLVDRRKRAMQ